MRCSDARLEEFLAADESSVEYRTTAVHVESCSRCQKRMLELSGDIAIQSEVREVLKSLDETRPYISSLDSSVVISIESTGDESAAEYEPISLDFLGSPSHPEMLGRIGRYEVERVIGSGGMGIVLKGFDTELHRVVAIKVLKPHLAHIGAARHRFSREAQSAAAVVHEHVIPIHDVQSDSDTPFLVMKYVPGQSLQARVDERGPLEAREVLRIGMQIASGLAAAHAQGLVHRDVKPANILLEDSVDRVLISDFGLARTVDDATLTRTGIVAGTPHYMSPEQASGQAVDHRSDLFSLGSLLYFMCAGRPPFRAEHALAILNRICHDDHRPVDEVNRDIPAELAELIDRLLSKRPGDRYRNGHEVEQRLEEILLQLQNGQSSRRLRWRRGWLRWRSSVVKSVIGVCAALAFVMVGIGLSQLGRGNVADPSAKRADNLSTDNQGQTTTAADSTTKGESKESPEEASDTYTLEMTKLSGDMDLIEQRWSGKQDRLTGFGADNWHRELEALRGMITSMERGVVPPSINDKQPIDQSGTSSERKEK